MKHIWAPWRMAYINSCQQDKRQKCVLCIKASSEKNDAAALILLRGKYSFVMMNRYPYNPGHLMIAPYRHSGKIESFSSKETSEMFYLLQQCVKVISKTLKPDGFNIGANLGRVAGAGIPNHFHMHLVPRWNGDTNFMPILTDTKIICQELERTYEILKKALTTTLNKINR
ncbi:MAG: HIT domain-containing protein [candidate division WOR-3 bacterium]|nr:HIT domain-containing protein [candidate division WOR-3 bacterium]